MRRRMLVDNSHRGGIVGHFLKRNVVLLVFVLSTSLLHADDLDDLARDFWAWRAMEQPISTDDIPRLERPPGWVPDWSLRTVVSYRRRLDEFEARRGKMNLSSAPIPRQVDYRLIGSALAPVPWALAFEHGWPLKPKLI